MKKILITGASSGIGLELVKTYAIDGDEVFACCRNSEPLKTLSFDYPNIRILQFDATNKSETENALSAIKEPLDIIILNAGNCEYIENGIIDSQVFKRVFEINFFAVLYCIENLQSHFTKNTHLALMGSSASYLPFSRSEAYGASKAALNYFANSLAVDLNSKINMISLISPGFVKTPLTDKNDFPMPMIISVKQAAKEIKKGLIQKKTEIHFPKRLTLILKFLSLLPMKWQRKLMIKLIRKN